MSTMSDKLSLAKSIILTGSTLKLNGALLYSFDIQFRDVDHKFAFVRYKPEQNKFEINISKKMCESYDAKELAFILVHEQSHPLLNHHGRCSNTMDHDIFNIAADHVINNPLRIDIDKGLIKGLKVPEDAVIINSIKDDNMSMEEVYLYLKKHAKVETETYEIQMEGNPSEDDSNSCDNGQDSDSDEDGNSESEGSNENENREDEDNNKDSEKDGESKEENKQSSNSNSSQSGNGSGETVKITKLKVELPDGQTFELLRDIEPNKNASGENEAEKDIRANARRLLNSNIFKNDRKNKGTGTGSFFEMIEDELAVEIPWEELLENVIKANITEISDNKTWQRVNKRMYNYGMVLPYYSMEETFDTLYIITDTSGSVGTNELMKFKNIIKGSMHHFKRVVKIDHDTNITNITVFEMNNIDSIFDNSAISFHGRGGTSHQEVYELLEKIYIGEDHKYLDKLDKLEPSLILFLTDFYSDIRHCHDNSTWVKEIPYKYIISGVEKDESGDLVPSDIDNKPIFIGN